MKNWSVGQQTFFRFVCSDGAYLELAVPQLPVRADGAQPLRDVRPVPSHRGPGGLSQPRPDRQVGPPQRCGIQSSDFFVCVRNFFYGSGAECLTFDTDTVICICCHILGILFPFSFFISVFPLF